jgi:hypothetical protein
MAWVWWLLAPVASTVIGTAVIWWRAPATAGKRLGGPDPIAEHQALLRVLAQGAAADEVPVTMRVLSPEPPAN